MTSPSEPQFYVVYCEGWGITPDAKAAGADKKPGLSATVVDRFHPRYRGPTWRTGPFGRGGASLNRARVREQAEAYAAELNARNA